MKQVCSVIVSFLLPLSLDALKSPCPWEAGVKRPKATWEREMGHVFICARALLLDGTPYLALDVCTRAQSCVI